MTLKPIIIFLVYFFIFPNFKAADTCMLKLELVLLRVAAVSKLKRRMWAPCRPQNAVNFSWYLGMKWKAQPDTPLMLPAGLTTLIQLLREQWQHMAGVERRTGLLLSATISIKITLSAVSRCIFKVQTFDTAEPVGQFCLQHPRVPGPAVCLPAPAWWRPRGLLTSLKIISARNSFTFLCPVSKLRKLPGQQGVSFTGGRDWTRQARQRGKQGGGGRGGGRNMLVFSAGIREAQLWHLIWSEVSVFCSWLEVRCN